MKRISLLIPILLLAACSVTGVDVEQEAASGLAGELVGGHSFGQSFTVNYDGLHRIDLYTATYARANTQPVIFTVKPEPGDSEDLIRLELAPSEISNSGPTVISFPPLAASAGKTLYLSVESPGSVPGDAISLYRHTEDVYPGGQMFVDDQPVDGDLAFIAYTGETFDVTDIWHSLTTRINQDRPFFDFYCVLLVSLLVALGVTVGWSLGRRYRNRTGFDDAQSVPSAPGPITSSDEKTKERE